MTTGTASPFVENNRPKLLPAMFAMIAFLKNIFITLKSSSDVFPEEEGGKSDACKESQPCKGIDDRRATVAIAVPLEARTKEGLPTL